MKKLILVIGLAVGFVLGSRMGRGPYNKLEQTARQFADDPRVQEKVEQTLPNVKFGEPHRAARQVMGVLSPEIQAALMGQKTPQQALDAAAEAAKPLIR